MTNDRGDEIMRNFDAVAERLETQIAQVGEGVVLTNERLDRADVRLGRMETRAEAFENEVRAGFGRVDARFDRMEARTDSLENEVRAGFAEVKSMIKLSYVELEGRMSSLERELLDLRSRVQKLETRA